MILLFRLQGSDLGPAGGADAVTLILGHVGHQLAAEIAAAGGTVLFEDDLIALHEDLELRVLVDVHIGAQFLGKDDTPQRVDATNDASCFHIHFSFGSVSGRMADMALIATMRRKKCSCAGKTGKNCQLLSYSVYKKLSRSSIETRSFDKNFSKKPQNQGQELP